MARWVGLKGKLWTLFSIYTRKRDCFKYGTCVSCNTPIEWDHCDAGHFIAVTGSPLKLIFDERNVNAQCKKCNNPAWAPTHVAYSYSLELDRRWGEGTAKLLHSQKNDSEGPWSELEYKSKIEHYKNENKNL